MTNPRPTAHRTHGSPRGATHGATHGAAHGANSASASVGAPRPGRGLRVTAWVAAGALGLLMIKWVLITAVLVAGPFALWWVIDRASHGRRARAEQATAGQLAARRRREVESRAVVDAAGGCGWCGTRTAHRTPTGRIVLPLEYHRADIEHTLAATPTHTTAAAAA